MVRGWLDRAGPPAGVAILLLQWGVLRLLLDHEQLAPSTIAASAGLAIFGAAFALSWAAEAAQHDIPPALSLAFLALIAVLPEYAVDLYFAWEAGKDPVYVQYATANMTGANRILIGFGWPMVVAAFFFRARKRVLVLQRQQGIEMYFLLVATAYSFVIPWKGTLTVWDSAVLVTLFIVYIVAASRFGHEEPELVGTAERIGRLADGPRRVITILLFVIAGAAILSAAEPFAEALLDIGERFGIDEFLLVQWLAPLASESPEFIVAIIFALRLKANAGFSALLSSKVNQWTLLIGTLPIAYSLSSGTVAAMHLDERQVHEVLLTSAQSLFAIVLLVDLRFGLLDAVLLFTLFTIQLAWPDPFVRMVFVGIYLGLSVVLVAFDADRRRALVRLLRTRPFASERSKPPVVNL